MRPFKLIRPTTAKEAMEAQKGNAAPYMAAGTDLLNRIKEHVASPDSVVDLKQMPGMGTIESDGRGIWLGALVKLTDVADHEEIQRRFPAVSTTVRNAATPQIRNMATVGGNMCQKPRCWYLRHEGYPCIKNGGTGCWAKDGENEFHAIYDNQICSATQPSNLAPVLVAHDAIIEIEGKDGVKELTADEFFIGPSEDPLREVKLDQGEFVRRVLLPASTETSLWAYEEAREKQSFDWAQASVTILLDRGGRKGDHRVIFGAVSPAPLRREDIEKKLDGSDDEATQASLIVGVGANPLSHNAYKVPMLQGLMRRAVRTVRSREEG
ncbi:MAG: hypothetical protein CBC13_10610 [Planctomycetia bacterium TMED53]|nr:MAG: hypothetical protein CBC13_10610 [Planctomycetia bacterium TMED53]